MTISLSELLRAKAKVLLVGPPGCGKTARILAAADDSGHAVEILRAGLADRIDIGGAIVPDHAAGIARELPLEQIQRLRDSEKPTLLFLDDLGQAPTDVQAACMRLFDSGYLPPNVLIWGATNRPGDKAGVMGLCEPLRSRFDVAFTMPQPPRVDTDGKARKSDAPDMTAVALDDWKSELDEWCSWALGVGAAPEIVAWHRSTVGRTLYQWQPCADPAARFADYRSWESVIKLHKAGLRTLDHVAACVGYPAAIEYHAFAALSDKIPSIAEIEQRPKKASVPKEPAALWLLSTAIGAALSGENAAALCQYVDRIPRVFGALAMRDGWRRGAAGLGSSPAWSEWFAKNRELFA